MISDLDDTIRALFLSRSQPGTELRHASATMSFEMPDTEWRDGVQGLTLSCYLYDIRENVGRKTTEPILQTDDQGRKVRRAPPVRVDCSYCLTAWSRKGDPRVADEHRLLSQALLVLLRHPTLPSELLQGSLRGQIPPYPTVVASAEGVRNNPEFWSALGQQPRPSLNYVVTLAMLIDEPPAEALAPNPTEIRIGAWHDESDRNSDGPR